jgi:uncharacterized membrane protein
MSTRAIQDQYRYWEKGHDERHKQVANGLGWFSIGLGLAELAAPKRLARFIGITGKNRSHAILRLYGLREIAAGVGILSQSRSAGWLWGRVAGDVLDLASLGSALTSRRAEKIKVGTATAAVLGVTALDVACACQASKSSTDGEDAGDSNIHVTKTIVVGRSPGEVYLFWRDFSNLARFMRHLESVEITGDRRSHWKANVPGGQTIEWDADLVEDEPNSRIAWRSLQGSELDNSGSVSFERAPGGRGTLVRVEMQYGPPGGVIGAKLAKLFRAEPGQQIEDDLRAFKQVMETGEIAKSDPGIHRGLHPARPSAKAARA